MSELFSQLAMKTSCEWVLGRSKLSRRAQIVAKYVRTRAMGALKCKNSRVALDSGFWIVNSFPHSLLSVANSNFVEYQILFKNSFMKTSLPSLSVNASVNWKRTLCLRWRVTFETATSNEKLLSLTPNKLAVLALRLPLRLLPSSQRDLKTATPVELER